jgi:hypothetical protein
MQLQDGSIIPSGMRWRPANAYQDTATTMGWVTRAVVLSTYFADEDDRNGWTTNQRAVLCDVRTYGRYSHTLDKVPVLQAGHGLWDVDVRIPRPSRVNLDGGDVLTDPSGDKTPTSAENLDGDHVLVGFLDNDPNQPVILPFTLARPNSNYTPKAADGRVRRIRHNGTLFEIDKDGNLTIDARGAAKEQLGVKGAEVSNSGTGGKLLWITKDGSGNVTSIQLDNTGKIRFGGAPGTADEPYVLGNVLKAIMADIMQALTAMTVMTPFGPSSPPINLAQFQTAFNRFVADEHSSDFIFGKKTY